MTSGRRGPANEICSSLQPRLAGCQLRTPGKESLLLVSASCPCPSAGVLHIPRFQTCVCRSIHKRNQARGIEGSGDSSDPVSSSQGPQTLTKLQLYALAPPQLLPAALCLQAPTHQQQRDVLSLRAGHRANIQPVMLTAYAHSTRTQCDPYGEYCGSSQSRVQWRVPMATRRWRKKKEPVLDTMQLALGWR